MKNTMSFINSLLSIKMIHFCFGLTTKLKERMNTPIFLYVPSKPPFDLWNRESPRGVKLYIQRVFIMDDASHFLPLIFKIC